jgi:hypothetical protein
LGEGGKHERYRKGGIGTDRAKKNFNLVLFLFLLFENPPF